MKVNYYSSASSMVDAGGRWGRNVRFGETEVGIAAYYRGIQVAYYTPQHLVIVPNPLLGNRQQERLVAWCMNGFLPYWLRVRPSVTISGMPMWSVSTRIGTPMKTVTWTGRMRNPIPVAIRFSCRSMDDEVDVSVFPYDGTLINEVAPTFTSMVVQEIHQLLRAADDLVDRDYRSEIMADAATIPLPMLRGVIRERFGVIVPAEACASIEKLGEFVASMPGWPPVVNHKVGGEADVRDDGPGHTIIGPVDGPPF